MMEFRILHGGSKAVSRFTALDFRRAELTTLSTYLQESHGLGIKKVGGTNRAGYYSSITSSMLRTGASP